MIHNRLDRRLVLLRAKRLGTFDPDQRYLEQAERTRVARQLRVLLRRGVPVAMVTPRWSQARRFLDDVSADLLLGEPSVVCRTLSLAPLQGRTPQQAWAWLVQAVTEFCRLDLEGPAWQVVSRRGFRHVMAELFERADHGPRRCLMIHGAQHIHVEALRDLVSVMSEHVTARTDEPHFNLVLSGAVEADQFAVRGGVRLVLPDYGPPEARENLAENDGLQRDDLIDAVTELVGGVPAFLDTLGTRAADLKELLVHRDNVWGLLGPLGTDIRTTIANASSDEASFSRLETLCAGPAATRPVDRPLQVSGLVRIENGLTRLRAPILADVVRDG